ncbi:MAG: hypothetical protein CM15mV6_2540 [uncultured marine virus]|nr:MAG: hypothetical protein CM15mV6_2540 [uncultured marine virus]
MLQAHQTIQHRVDIDLRYLLHLLRNQLQMRLIKTSSNWLESEILKLSNLLIQVLTHNLKSHLREGHTKSLVTM